MLVHGLHILNFAIRSSTGSGLGAISTSQRFSIGGKRSTSMNSGFTSTLPGANGTKVVSICIGRLHRLSS